MLRRVMAFLAKKWKLLAIGVMAFSVLWMIFQGYSLAWTGFGDFTNPKGDFERGKTLWDWMELLLIPIFLAVGGYLIDRSERKGERELSVDRQQEEALQIYLGHMTDLLLKERLSSGATEEVKDVARIRTLAVLRHLDGKRKRLVVLFLKEASLLDADSPIIRLDGADIRGADLSNTTLNKSNLSHADLSGATFEHASLAKANFSGAKLINSNLHGTDFEEASLEAADLSGANLRDAILEKAKLTYAKLVNARLYRCDLSDSVFINADLSRAELKICNLTGADFSNANLTRIWTDSLRVADSAHEKVGANFTNATIFNAWLYYAYLVNCDFTNANLSATLFQKSDLSHSNFTNADLSKSALLSTKFTDIQLSKAKSVKGMTVIPFRKIRYRRNTQ